MGDKRAHDNTPGRQSKVARLIDEYGLHGIGLEMEQRWTAEGDNRASLRDLADRFNKRILSEALTEAKIHPLGGEVETTYSLLTEDEASSANRTRVRRRLEREGVDIERVLDDFVTYQSVRTYLTKCRNAEYTRNERNQVEAVKQAVQRIRGWVTSVVESKFDQLRKKEDIHLGSYRVLVDIKIVCEDCSKQYEASQFLDQGSCGCDLDIE